MTKKPIVGSGGRVTIPAEIRRKLHIRKGTRLHIEERGYTMVVAPITPEYIASLAGILKTKGGLAKELLEERARDRERGA